MKFLVDAQLPLTLAKWLRGRDCDALHVLECDRAQTKDRDLWTFAEQEERIVISKDEDFLILACRPGDTGRLLWIRLGNCRTSTLLTVLNRQWETIARAFQEGQQIVEVR